MPAEELDSFIDGAGVPRNVQGVCVVDNTGAAVPTGTAASPSYVLAAGTLDHDAVAGTVKPVIIGGKARNAIPTQVAQGDVVQAYITDTGALVTAMTGSAGLDGQSNANMGFQHLTTSVSGVALNANMIFNGTTWDRMRGNIYGLAVTSSPQACADGNGNTGSVITDSGGSNRPQWVYSSVFNGTTWDRQRGDTTGTWVSHGIAHDAVFVGNTVPIGGKCTSTGSFPVTVAVGDKVDALFNGYGTLMVGSPNVTIGDGNSTVLAGLTDLAGTARALWTSPQKFNGTTWDRARKPNGAARLVSAANSNNAAVAKASAGDLHTITGYNASASLVYLKVYNKATAPTVGTDTPVLTIALAPTAPFSHNFSGLYFSAGISYGTVTGSGDADNTSVALGDIKGLNITYA
jgi:hypothetical protein